jgi:hypothetical protein
MRNYKMFILTKHLQLTHVRTNNLGKRWEQERYIELRWFELWPTFTRQNLLWKDEKTQEKKKGTQLIFIGILILVIIEDVKGWENKKKKFAHDRILIPCKN